MLGRRFAAIGWMGLVLFAAPGWAAPRETAAEWIRRERVRCLAYVGVSPKADEQMRRTREMGFNCALTVTGDAPVEKLMPLAKAADRHGLRIIWVSYLTNQFSNPTMEKALADVKRRFVGADGRVSPPTPCPQDPRYWKITMLDRALPLARLAGQGRRSSAGLLLDLEDYSGVGDWAHFCHCDFCFDSFCKAAARSEAAGLAPDKRHGWLVDGGLWARYCEHQDRQVVKILADIRRQVDAVAPDFMFAYYPWGHLEAQARGSEVPWDERFCAGLGTARAPYLVFDEGTYSFGYEPRIEAWSAELQAKGLHFAAVPGFNLVPAERVWWPRQMADSAYHAATRAQGYWFFVGDWVLLREPGEELPAMWGGRREEWVSEFTRLNRLIAQAAAGKTARATAPAIPLPPVRTEVRAYQPPDLFDQKHSPGSQMLIRSWADIGLPWREGEMLLPARKAGDWLSFERDIRRADRYQVSAWFTMGPDRGQVQLYVGGEPAGEPVDLYSPTTMPTQYRVIGQAVLQAGRARLEFRAAGKNPLSRGYVIGFTMVGIEAIGWPPAQWNVALPFDNTGENQPGYSAVFAPERNTNLDATYEGKGGVSVRWQAVRAEAGGYLDLLPLVSDARNNVAYALVYVYAPSEGLRSVLVGSDDGAKLWVNDEFVWGENTPRSAQRDEDRPMAHLRPGWNKVLAKITQTGGAWGLYFRIYDPDNTLRYALRPD